MLPARYDDDDGVDTSVTFVSGPLLAGMIDQLSMGPCSQKLVKSNR